ncbi:MAG TPA: alpha/beta hydrolase [Caulobacteraceae bacterium]
MDSHDAGVVDAMRNAAAPRKGAVLGPKARPDFNAGLAANAPFSPDVQFWPDVVGGVPGLWCESSDADFGAQILFLHGGCYVLGSAEAARNFAAQFATRAHANTFVADYRLAPEHPFPAAMDDALAVYQGVAEGADRIALVGESAGGGLALALLAILAGRDDRPGAPRGVAVMSPWTDLALTGASLTTRADADPIFTKPVLAHFADLYLQGADPKDPRASPLYGPAPEVAPPIRIDVGDDEVLLDDSLRYAEKLRDANLHAAVHVWSGMPHVFPSAIGRLKAANLAADEIGAFLRDCLR